MGTATVGTTNPTAMSSDRRSLTLTFWGIATLCRQPPSVHSFRQPGFPFPLYFPRRTWQAASQSGIMGLRSNNIQHTKEARLWQAGGTMCSY